MSAHKGPLPTPDGDVQPTGGRAQLHVGAFITFDAGGLVADSRRYYDVAGPLKQLGL